MSAPGQGETPFLFREIHKTAYLRWLPPEYINGKFKHGVNKKHNVTPTWTVLCVHNGVAPYLEQYPSPTSAECLSHRPMLRVSLSKTRHITASIRPWPGDQYDFLLVTQNGAARMLAPDWNSMQDWVTTLRVKLRELKILDKGENVYGAPPQAPVPRAPARDPHSPLPPAPPLPTDRIPGIEIPTQQPPSTSNIDQNQTATFAEENNDVMVQSNDYAAVPDLLTQMNIINIVNNESSNLTDNITLENIDNSTSNEPANPQNVETPILSNIPSTSNIDVGAFLEDYLIGLNDSDINTLKVDFPNLSNASSISAENSKDDENGLSSDLEQDLTAMLTHLPLTDVSKKEKSVKKIAGQNICFDDSILKRVLVSDDEFFEEFDRILKTESNLNSIKVESPTENSSKIQIGANKNELNTQCVKVEDEITRKDGYTKVDVCKKSKFKNQVTISSDSVPSTSSIPITEENSFHPNITVIQVSNNRQPPHSAIPLTNTDTPIFDFPIVQNDTTKKYVNIVATEGENSQNATNSNTGYGHISMTTVKLTGESNNQYERVAIATTSKQSPKVRRKFLESLSRPARKTSLPDPKSIKTALNKRNDPTYEYLYPVRKNGVTATSNVVTTTSNGVTTTSYDVTTGGNSVARTSGVENEGISEGVKLICDRRPKNSFLTRKFSTSPRRDEIDIKTNPNKGGLFKRGFTELSFLSKLKDGLVGYNKHEKQNGDAAAQNGGQATPNNGQTVQYVRQNGPHTATVTHRSRRDSAENDVEFGARRRSSSLSADSQNQVITLRAQQVAQLRSEQTRCATILMRISRVDLKSDRPVFADAMGQVWICAWGRGGWVCGGRAGDRVLRVRGSVPRNAAHATELLTMHSHAADIEFNRIPQGKVYLLVRRNEREPLGLRLDSTCRLAGVSEGAAARAGLPNGGRWTLTEINNRPLKLVNGYEAAMTLLNARGTELSIVLQPTQFVDKLRSALNKAKH